MAIVVLTRSTFIKIWQREISEEGMLDFETKLACYIYIFSLVTILEIEPRLQSKGFYNSSILRFFLFNSRDQMHAQFRLVESYFSISLFDISFLMFLNI